MRSIDQQCVAPERLLSETVTPIHQSRVLSYHDHVIVVHKNVTNSTLQVAAVHTTIDKLVAAAHRGDDKFGYNALYEIGAFFLNLSTTRKSTLRLSSLPSSGARRYRRLVGVTGRRPCALFLSTGRSQCISRSKTRLDASFGDYDRSCASRSGWNRGGKEHMSGFEHECAVQRRRGSSTALNQLAYATVQVHTPYEQYDSAVGIAAVHTHIAQPVYATATLQSSVQVMQTATG